MREIACATGPTQIGKVLTHARGETKKNKVAAMVFVGDCLEEHLMSLPRPQVNSGFLAFQ